MQSNPRPTNPGQKSPFQMRGRPPFRPGGARPGGRPPHRPGGARPGGPAAGQGGPGGPRFGGQSGRTAVAVARPPVRLPSQATVSELASILDVSVPEVIKTLITKAGMMANINQALNRDTMVLVATELGYEIEEEKEEEAEPASGDTSSLLGRINRMAADEIRTPRPPIVTVMGHVDHGKTSLLDAIRQTNVTASEAGGITQHIGAYQVEKQGRRITFLDTPGHEAFTAMRARGIQATDVAVIVIAADDGVMPQTREAIDHAKAAGVPLLIALNKIDLPGANIDRVKQQLSELGIFVEGYGGDVVALPVSARQKKGIDELLEMILIVSDLEEPKANADRSAQGVIIESRKDPTMGPLATALVLNGTLTVGDVVVIGSVYGKVRAMIDDRGKRVRKAEPSTPVEIMGLPESKAGDQFEVVHDERVARAITEERQQSRASESGRLSLDDLAAQARAGQTKEFNLIVKADVQGSLEAIRHSVERLEVDEVHPRIIHMATGNVTQSDILLAVASRAIVVGFHVKVDPSARDSADAAHVDVRMYDIIYKLTDDLEAALKGMREPKYEEVIYGHAEVRQLFKLPNKIVIAGCRVTDGTIVRGGGARVQRGGEVVFTGRIGSLRHLKDDVREVATGFECGIGIDEYNDTEAGDIIEAFGLQKVE